jgi:hypothetical protein
MASITCGEPFTFAPGTSVLGTLIGPSLVAGTWAIATIGILTLATQALELVGGPCNGLC